jgi:hypothetical protein
MIPHAAQETMAPIPVVAQIMQAVPRPEIKRPIREKITPRTPGVVVLFLFALIPMSMPTVPKSRQTIEPHPQAAFPAHERIPKMSDATATVMVLSFVPPLSDF